MPIVPAAMRFDGFVSDVSREQIPKNLVYRMKDWIPNNGAPGRKRGGWPYASTPISGSDWISGLGWFQNPGDATKDALIIVTNDGEVYQQSDFSSDTSPTRVGSLGTSNPLKHKPIFFLGELMIFNPEGDVNVWDGSSLTSGSNNWKAGAEWGNFVVLADGTDIAWGEDASSVLAGSTATAPADVITIATFPHLILLFGYTDVWALIGDDPPPGGDLRLQTLFSGVGCMDARSLTTIAGRVYWANSSGVYSTNGGDLQNLTDGPILPDGGKGIGITRYWRDLVSGFNLNDGWVAAGGEHRGCYLISVHDDAGALVVTLVYDISRQTWFEFTNWGAGSYAHRPDSAGVASSVGTEELFFGLRSVARIASSSSAWEPDTTNPSDGDGTPVLPEIELPYWSLAQGQQRIRRVFVTYDLRAEGSVEPVLRTSFVTSPDDEYTASTKTLPTTSRRTRQYTDVRRKALGVGLKITQSNISSDTKLYAVELEEHGVSVTRRGA